MYTDIHPKPKRKVTFEVGEVEARQIAGYLSHALAARFNTPFSSVSVRTIMNAFSDIAEGK